MLITPDMPIGVGTLMLKNRLIMTAMHHLYTENGLPTPRFNEYYWRRAEGGAGLITVGACRFDSHGAKASTMSLADDGCIEPWREFTGGMRERGCPVSVQLYHAGRYMKKSEVMADDEAIGPSAVYTPFTRETCRAMTEGDIERVIGDFAAGARRARAAGFDAVEVSAASGYLLNQFLSPLANVRDDAWGGSFERRCRFPLAVLAAIRAAVGADFPIILRLGGNDLVPGSNGSEECFRFGVLAAAGADMLSMTGGWHESRTPQLTGELPLAGLAYLAKRVRDNVAVPVAMANRTGSPETAARLLALGFCDIIAMGRPLVADAELPKKIIEGRPHAVRPCVSCNQGCLAGTFFEKPVRCLANGLAGREYLFPETPAARKKRLLVVGGGPGGAEAAIRAAARGHDVALWEKSGALGGQLALAAALPFREGFARLLDYQRQALRDAGVRVELGREATAESVLSGGFDEVIIATGRAYKRELPVKIESGAPPVYTAEQYIKERPVLGRRVAVTGGSFVGLETARALLLEGVMPPEELWYLERYGVEPRESISALLGRSARQVAVFEKLPKLGAGYEPGIAWPVLGDLSHFGAELRTGTEVTGIDGGGVHFGGGVWPCDAVVVAVGTEAQKGLYEAIKDRLPCHVTGNARRLGRAIDAIEQGAEIGASI